MLRLQQSLGWCFSHYSFMFAQHWKKKGKSAVKWNTANRPCRSRHVKKAEEPKNAQRGRSSILSQHEMGVVKKKWKAPSRLSSRCSVGCCFSYFLSFVFSGSHLYRFMHMCMCLFIHGSSTAHFLLLSLSLSLSRYAQQRERWTCGADWASFDLCRNVFTSANWMSQKAPRGEKKSKIYKNRKEISLYCSREEIILKKDIKVCVFFFVVVVTPPHALPIQKRRTVLL